MSKNLSDCDDCTPNEPYNPKQNRRLIGGKSGAFGDVHNPLANELKDIEQVRKTYSLLPIMPFYEGGDASLAVFRMLKDLSPTHGACISSIGGYVLSGELEIVPKKLAGFAEIEGKKISTADKEQFAKFVNSLNPEASEHGGLHLLNAAEGIYQNKMTYGNSFLRLNMVTVGNSRYCYIDNIDCENVRYWATLANEPKMAVISPLWTYDYIMRHPPEMVGVFPNVTENANGVLSTIFHDFKKVPARDWYGQPTAISSIYYQFAEVQQGQYFTEGYASDFSGRVAFEFVGTSDDDETNFQDAVENTFTNKAGKDKKRVIMRMRAPEDSPMTIHEFAANTEHQFHIGTSELTEKQIIKSHDWSKILMGIPQAGKLGGANEFIEIYKQKNITLLNPIRISVMRSINSALCVAEEFVTGKRELTDKMSLGLLDLYKNELALAQLATTSTTGQ
jgi:hypothetical protein